MMDDLRDIKPPLPMLAFPHWPAWAWLAAALVLLLVLGLCTLALGRWRQDAPQRRVRRALARELDRLARDAANLDDRAFASDFAALVRRMLARRTGPAALAMTTDELVAHLAASGLPSRLTTDLAAALERSDPARYAPTGTSSLEPPLRGDALDLLRALLRRSGPC